MIKDKEIYCPGCLKLDIRYPLIKYNDGVWRCGFCKFETSLTGLKSLKEVL